MPRKPSGFWPRKDVQHLLERYVTQAISLDEAASELQVMCKKEGVTQSLDELRDDVKWYARGVRRRLGSLPPARTKSISVRLSPDTFEAARDLARRASRSIGSMVSELAEEALRMRQHPGIVFAGPPGNRRARLESGPDVWEIVAIHRVCGGDATRTLQVLTHLVRGQLEAALRYFQAHREEIESAIAENERPLEEWRRLYPHLIPVPQTAG